MAQLPVVFGDEFVRAMEDFGFVFVRMRGSHMVMKHPRGTTLSVPRHRELRRGTLVALLRYAGISRNEFLQHLRRR